MAQLGQLLEYGFMGLALALAILAYSLLRAEQGKPDTPAARLKLIKLFLLGAPVIAVIAGVFATIEVMVERGTPTRVWTVQGRVEKEGSTDHSGVRVEIIPPLPSTSSFETGWFEMDGVPIGSNKPKVLFSSPGYLPYDASLTPKTAVIDPIEHTVTLEDTIRMFPLEEEPP
jgi:hypothetical protein